MFMDDNIIFDSYYCINSAQTRNNGALYFTASSHFHMRKSFYFYAGSGRTSVSHY